jgi:hypothetical protein
MEQLMYVEALERVAVIMDNITSEVFDLEDFLYIGTRELEMLVEQAAANTDAPWYEINQTCGTIACAVGHAGLNPWFRSQGFKTNIREANIEYKMDVSWDAIENFFEVSKNEALYLFASQSYLMTHDPKAVAKRIRLFIATDGKSHTRYLVRRKAFIESQSSSGAVNLDYYDFYYDLPKEFFAQEET